MRVCMRHIHYFEDFYEKFTYPIFLNKWRITTPKSACKNLARNYPFYIFSMLLKSIEEEI